MLIGSHVSISGGLLGAAQEAFSYGANTFMVYTGAPQNTARRSLGDLKIEEGKAFMASHGISDIVVHAPYIINLASYKEEIYSLAKEFLALEISRTNAFGSKLLVLHPGAFTDKTLEFGISRIADGINSVLTDDMPVTICLETMAGKGSEIGRNFEELKLLIDKIHLKEKIGICFDSCHTHDSGYDIKNNLQRVFDTFEKEIGLDKIKVFHINGSLNPCGAKKDRHANIGADHLNAKGEDNIGFDALHKLVLHPAAFGKPLILETPWLDKKTNFYKEEISMLRGDLK